MTLYLAVVLAIILAVLVLWIFIRRAIRLYNRNQITFWELIVAIIVMVAICFLIIYLDHTIIDYCYEEILNKP